MVEARSAAHFDIFVNYRREDTRADAGRLYDRLGAHFGPDHVFMDIDDIDAGQNFARVLEETLDRCSIVIVLIGQRWLDCRDADGQRRLEQPDDFIALEIRLALERTVTVVPVLVGGATMPTSSQIPDTIKGLALQQALEISDKRFHADVDALIEDLEAASGKSRPRSRVSRRALIGLAGAAIVGVMFALYLAIASFVENRQIEQRVRAYVEVGDRFLAQENHARAIDEYKLALEIEPDDVPALRKLLTAKRLRLSVTAFSGIGAGVDIGLRRDFQRFAPVPAVDVDDAIQTVYRLRSLRPEFEDDADLLRDEALIWKASGARAANALPPLRRAAELDPDNAEVQAELGLLSTMLAGEVAGEHGVRRAIAINANEPRYHFYLARILTELHRCTNVGDGDPRPGDAAPCAEAVRQYRRASELAVSDDRWARQIRTASIERSLDIFFRYANSEIDGHRSKLDMSVDERIEALEYLVPRARTRSRGGEGNFASFALALLYEVKGDFNKAMRLATELIDGQSAPPMPWLELYARTLEKTGTDPGELAQVRSRIQQRRNPQ